MISDKRRKHSPRRGFASNKEGSSRGFTLVELMVVVAIIGILATIGVATYSRTQARARDAKRKADMVTIQNALEMYASENNGNYPDPAGWVTGGPTSGCWISALCPTYIKKLPVETYHASDFYGYCHESDCPCGGGYVLHAYLETEDGQNCSCGSYGGGGWYCVENP